MVAMLCLLKLMRVQWSSFSVSLPGEEEHLPSTLFVWPVAVAGVFLHSSNQQPTL